MKKWTIRFVSYALSVLLVLAMPMTALSEDILIADEYSISEGEEVQSEAFDFDESEVVVSEPVDAEVGEVEFELGEEYEQGEESPVISMPDEELNDVESIEKPAIFAASSSGFTTAFFEHAKYKIINCVFLNLKKTPYSNGENAGIVFSGATVTIWRFVENSYGNLWAETTDNKYIYAGCKKVNGKWQWQENDPGFISFVENLSEPVHSANIRNQTLKKGSNFSVSGVISSDSAIGSVDAYICNAANAKALPSNYLQFALGIKPKKEYGTEVELNQINGWGTIDFAKLPIGEYVMVLCIHHRYNCGLTYDPAGSLQIAGHYSLLVPFKVVESYSVSTPDYGSGNTASSITFSNIAYPSKYVVGTSGGYALTTGTVSSTYPLVSLRSEIVSADGQTVSAYTRSISGTSYQIKNLDTYSSSDNGVHFSWIKTPGTYYWKLTATDSKGYSQTTTMKFTAVSSGTSTTSVADTPQPAKVYLDLNGWINGAEAGDLAGRGTVDVYINGSLVANDVTDYYTQWPQGTSYEIKDIRATNGYAYKGVHSGSLSGKVGSSLTKVVLTFDPISATGISLNKTTLSLAINNTYTLSATISPSNALDKSVTWSSSNTAVVRVNSNGVVTGVSSGTAKITAKTANGKTATATVTVTPPPKPTKVTLNKTGTVTLNLGSTLALTPTLSPSNAQTTFKWSTSNSKIAKVSGGVVTPVKEGTATITVKTANSKKATVKVKVVDPYKPTKVTLDKTGTVTLSIYDTLTLKPTLAPATARTTFTWTTSNKKIAKVSNGVVTPVKKGTATITVKTANGKKATVKVKVVDPYAPKLVKIWSDGSEIIPKSTVSVDLYDAPWQLYGIAYISYPSWASNLYSDSANQTKSWKSSNSKVATIDKNGIVRYISEGKTKITVTTYNGKSTYFYIKVVDPYKPTKVTLSEKSTLTLHVGDELQLYAYLKPSTARTTLKWKSSNSKIAKAYSDGSVSALKKGTCTITVTTANGKKATLKIKVK